MRFNIYMTGGIKTVWRYSNGMFQWVSKNSFSGSSPSERYADGQTIILHKFDAPTVEEPYCFVATLGMAEQVCDVLFTTFSDLCSFLENDCCTISMLHEQVLGMAETDEEAARSFDT